MPSLNETAAAFPPIPAQIGYMADEITSLNETIAILAKRLQPVCTKLEDPKRPTSTWDADKSDVAQDLFHHNEALRSLNSDLHTLISRIEL